mmetsp:Transcript_16330/g.27618  ORF Transcript_16330/g.27618 Transcript_16330/m.27618 type:complete len:216 (+) Transcript_16330:80-727(+)|eukprot:CAMPEP_0168622370 /NCGR_PEP_ID=MMETSP0449_2-20121227/8231_1 /TAXON_ID=1082188 /ORGANISM="Strombidium rassoulzadegani, Strain ras09" /LENGTH=215 /DNA_ID=CAMNT_0008663631 /DNA_START=1 /DNA_END=648 /DNA_ORIENTATION=+
MELNYWMRTFSTLTTEAALLCGFSFGGLSAIADFKGEHSNLNIGYLVATSTSMGCGLLCITTASFCLMLGPGKALRSNSLKGVEETIEVMKTKSFQCFWFFVSELMFFHIASFMLMWILYSPIVALVVNIVLLVFLLQFFSECMDIIERLYVKEDQAVSGKLNLLRDERQEVLGNLDNQTSFRNNFTAKFGFGSNRPVSSSNAQPNATSNNNDDL